MSSNWMQDPGLSLPRLDLKKSKFRIFCPDTFVDFCLGFPSGPQTFQPNSANCYRTLLRHVQNFWPDLIRTYLGVLRGLSGVLQTTMLLLRSSPGQR